MITTENISKWLKRPGQMEEGATEALRMTAMEYPHCGLFPYLLLFHATEREAQMQLRQLYAVNPILLQEWLTNQDQSSDLVEDVPEAQKKPENIEDQLLPPVSATDYFRNEGINISTEIPDLKHLSPVTDSDSGKDNQSLMVMMSFSEWLTYLHNKTRKAKEEEADQKALQTLLRRQKLAAAIEEENEEIPDQVFEMAVNSIAPQEDTVSEALADVYARQGKIQKAIEMYQKLSLQNPGKNVYFAHKIEVLQKEI